ncbi:MAG: translocation/assembly module TamB domain-containing protein, partial [Terrimicrobiaceae bacterium]
GLQLRANANLYASGDKAGGLIKGAVRFVDGRFSRRLEITPLMSVPAAGDKLFEPPQLERSVPPPFNIWKLDVSIANDTPFLFSGNAASGEIIPELELTGTLGNPIPVGQVELKDARVFLPFTTMTIPDGRIDFVEDSPWMPQLNLRGTAQALDYEVQAYAFGPLNERRLILRSEPPLPQDSLIQLLTTGMAPRVYAAPGFGEIPGPGGSTPLRAFGREFDLQGVQADSTVSGLPVGAAPVPFPGGRATLRGRFELWRGLSLMKEGDGLSSDRASFSLRVR